MQKTKFRLARVAVIGMVFLVAATAIAANRDEVSQAQNLKEKIVVKISTDGKEFSCITRQSTVGDILKELGIQVGPLDVVRPSTDKKPYPEMHIAVVRVREELVEKRVTIPFETVRTFTDSLKPGKVVIKNNGLSGEKTTSYLIRYEDGKPVKKTLMDNDIVQPEKRVYLIGSKGRYTSRGEFRSKRIVKMSASAYDPGPRSCGRYATGRTSLGLRAGHGVVAVDPKIIKLGSRLYIEGYGFAVAGDVGSAIKGRRIDLGFGSYREAIRFGRKNVNVHVLKK